jgi:tRNA A-37 threonylcarbamoyl transferase component Bud32
VTSCCLSVDDCLDHIDGRTDPTVVFTTQRHLDECRACCVMMAEAARGPAGSARPPQRAFLTFAVGDLVAGRYEIRRFVARGGMGEVYEAFDLVLEERVAVKTLVLAALDQEDATHRLIDEVRIARRVVHPNVCRITDVGFHHSSDSPDTPLPFLTMGFLDGETLARRIARAGRLAPADALPFFRDLTAGLAAVHRAGIIHRDFKSENVFLVGHENGAERAVVMDFGLAWVLERAADARRSSGRSVLGTVDYMAPEQVEGRTLTCAADVYALGVVMFEMLTGRTPFAGDSAAAVALSRLSREAPKLSHLVPELGAAWDSILDRCLARDPGRRFARMEDLEVALRSVEHRRPPARRRVVITASIALGVAAGIVTAGNMTGRSAASDATARAAVHQTAAVAFVPAPVVASAPAAAAPSVAERPPVSRRPARARPTRTVAVDPLPSAGAPPASTEARAALGADSPEALLVEAENLLAEGKLGEACAAGERSAQLRAGSDAHRFLGRCYMRLGHPARARVNYRKYLEGAESAPDASFVRAMLGTQKE